MRCFSSRDPEGFFLALEKPSQGRAGDATNSAETRPNERCRTCKYLVFLRKWKMRYAELDGRGSDQLSFKILACEIIM